MGERWIAGGLTLALCIGVAGCAGIGGGSSTDPATYCAELEGWSAEAATFEEEVLGRVNALRSRGGSCGSAGTFAPSGPLEVDEALTCAARVHARDMAERNYFDHTTPDGVSFGDRFELAGYDWSAAGENIAAGYETAEEVVDGWMESEAHCANIMSPLFANSGVGFYQDLESTYLFYWTQAFAAPE